MVSEVLGIQYNIKKADRTDRKVQKLASYINEDTLRAIHRTMDKRKEHGIDKVTKEEYEPKFYNESCGFRPNRNCHQAVREIIEMVQYRKTNYVVEADIRRFFDNVDHEWLMKMLAHDIADRRFLGIIEKFLKVGIMEDGRYLESERGMKYSDKGWRNVLGNMNWNWQRKRQR